MTRSPLAYPLARSVDAESGGAADLQTDIMRFMAILALCLVAIFALVQSIPMAPESMAPEPRTPSATAVAIPESPARPAPAKSAAVDTVPASPKDSPLEPVLLRRPKWQSTFTPADSGEPESTITADTGETIVHAPPPGEEEGFTLRFESDNALTRLVASGSIGLYAIDADGARRLTVSDSRPSFWEASTPNAFHEMEAATVPAAVVAALERTGSIAGDVTWGVTLPLRLSDELDTLVREHSGGTLVIDAGGTLRLEAQQ